MKKEYIKPTVNGIITLTENNLLENASNYEIDGGTGGKVTVDNSSTGSEAEGAAAKGYNPWTAWDD